jgi:hypothetical protein
MGDRPQLLRVPITLPANSLIHTADWWNGKIIGQEETVTVKDLFSPNLVDDKIPIVPGSTSLDHDFINAVIAAATSEE